MGVGPAAWVLHVAALSLAPMSLVQAVLAGGVALIAVMADRIFGFQVGRRQWWGLGLTAAGLVLLASRCRAARLALVLLPRADDLASRPRCSALGGLLIVGPRAGARAEHHGVVLAAASGVLFGVCNVAVKALSGLVGHDGCSASSAPGPLVALAASAAAFYASARSLQDGEAVTVIAITGTAASVCCIAGGILVFGDPMPGDAVGIVVQALAFLLVIVASALTPAPRAAPGGRAGAPAAARRSPSRAAYARAGPPYGSPRRSARSPAAVAGCPQRTTARRPVVGGCQTPEPRYGCPDRDQAV